MGYRKIRLKKEEEVLIPSLVKRVMFEQEGKFNLQKGYNQV